MARHTKIWVVESEGRDKGKAFLITEMFSSKGEKWAYRALLALINTNVQLPNGFELTGMAGLAQVGMQGLTGLPWHLAEPLLNELQSCVQIIPDYPKFNMPRPLEDGEGEPGSGDLDIDEVQTRMQLRLEVFKLHVDFSAAAIQSLIERVKTVMAARQIGSDIETGQQQSSEP